MDVSKGEKMDGAKAWRLVIAAADILPRSRVPSTLGSIKYLHTVPTLGSTSGECQGLEIP